MDVKKFRINIKTFIRKLFESGDFNWEAFSSSSSTDSAASEFENIFMAAVRDMEADPNRGDEINKIRQNKEKAVTDVLAANNAFLLSKGIDVSKSKKLGEGASGIAYDIGNTRVFKLTKDKGEFQTALKLKGKPIKSIANIYDAWPFEATDFYGIILERILPFDKWPNDPTKDAIEEVVDTYNLKNILMKNGSDWDKAWTQITSSSVFRAAQDKSALEKAFQALKLVNEGLKKEGIHDFFDLHLGNLGKRISTGEILFFDIGFSAETLKEAAMFAFMSEQKKSKRFPKNEFKR